MTAITVGSDIRVELVDHMGTDRSVVNAARVSTKGEAAHTPWDAEKDPGLINYLMRDKHGTPFEHNALQFFVRAPIFVYREWHRHRIGLSYNEESGRYKKLAPEFYIPSVERNLVQEGKPGHYVFLPGTRDQYDKAVTQLSHAYQIAYDNYEVLLHQGVAREVARMCLPVSIYSSQYVTCNLRSLMAFLSLRTRRDAPYFGLGQEGPLATTYDSALFPSSPMREIEMAAEKMEIVFAELFPVTYDAYCKHRRMGP